MVRISKIIRKKIIDKFTSKLKNQKNIVSITFVGSFIDKNDFDNINDIDLIVVTNRLNKTNFSNIVNRVKKVKLDNLISKKNKIIVNSTFGPLKFNKNKNDLVIHLMIYDIYGHIEHSLKSPFTVYDWERSNYFYKKKLKEIITVGVLQLRDFIEARRGIENYLNDIIKKQISFRKYKFYNSGYKTISKNIRFSERDKLEFYFHIVKNLLANFIKFKNKQNKLYIIKKNEHKIKKYFSKKFYIKNINNINLIFEKKNSQNLTIDKKLDKWIIRFIKDYEMHLFKLLKKSKKIYFFRHAKTKLNDGSFLGQNRDPDITQHQTNLKKLKISKIFTSPLKRCVSTVKILSKNQKYISDKDLLEINYGRAEGMSLKSLKKNFPYVHKYWLQKKDVKFPNGESMKDVHKRVFKFLKKLTKYKIDNSCVVTHNVFLRVLIGSSFNIPKEKWYKIYIPHLMCLEFLIIENRVYPNIERDKLKIIFSNLN